jgi:hypothetical protein
MVLPRTDRFFAAHVIIKRAPRCPDAEIAMHNRIIFEIEQDEDGYPGVGAETVWATSVGENTYKIDNIPFFVRDATLGDIIEATEINGVLAFKHTLSRSGNSLIRVHYAAEVDPQSIRDELTNLGCSSEWHNHDRLIAINVPPNVPLAKVQAFLRQGFEQERFDYEEAILMQ